MNIFYFLYLFVDSKIHFWLIYLWYLLDSYQVKKLIIAQFAKHHGASLSILSGNLKDQTHIILFNWILPDYMQLQLWHSYFISIHTNGLIQCEVPSKMGEIGMGL